MILPHYICPCHRLLFKSFSQQAVEVGARWLERPLPTGEGAEAAAQHLGELPSIPQHLQGQWACCGSKVGCPCFWRAGNCSAGADGMSPTRAGEKAGRAGRTQSSRQQGRCSGTARTAMLSDQRPKQPALLVQTTASTSYLKKWETICKDGKRAFALHPAGFLLKVWRLCLNTLSAPTCVPAEAFTHSA